MTKMMFTTLNDGVSDVNEVKAVVSGRVRPERIFSRLGCGLMCSFFSLKVWN